MDTTENPRRNFYIEFLNFSSWMGESQRKQRTKWYSGLDISDKKDNLFKFEMMLKGFMCFANPYNHPKHITGKSVIGPGFDAKDFSVEIKMMVLIIDSIIELAMGLKEDSDEIPTGVVDVFCSSESQNDQQRIDFARSFDSQESLEQGIDYIIGSMEDLRDLVEGVGGSSHVTHRQFCAVSKVICREISGSCYFNMSSLFEFREQYDKINQNQVLVTLGSIESDVSRKISSVSLLTLHRLLAYLDMVIEMLDIEMNNAGGLFAMLSVIHSDGQALADFLSNDSSTWISGGFGDEYQTLTPKEIRNNFDELDLQFSELKSLRELLESTGHQLSLELKKTFNQQLPCIAPVSELGGVTEEIKGAASSLRSFVQNAIVLLVKEFNVNLKGDDLFADFTSDLTRSLRLQRDIWMFRYILKAFVIKTVGTEEIGDKWAGLNTFKYVKTFVHYFRSMGYQLLRNSDYERFDKFMALVDRLRDGDVLEVQRLSHVIHECEAFYLFLDKMFDAIGERKELKDFTFDAKDAAQTLKLFIT